MIIIFCEYIRGQVLPDFLHQLPISDCSVLCYSRDAVPLGPEKDTCRQDSLSKWIDWYHSLPPSVFIRQYLVPLMILVNFTGIFVKLGRLLLWNFWPVSRPLIFLGRKNFYYILPPIILQTCLHRSESELLKMHALLLDNSLNALHSFSCTQKIKDHSSLLSARSIYKSDVPSSGY